MLRRRESHPPGPSPCLAEPRVAVSWVESRGPSAPAVPAGCVAPRWAHPEERCCCLLDAPSAPAQAELAMDRGAWTASAYPSQRSDRTVLVLASPACFGSRQSVLTYIEEHCTAV